MTEPETWKDLLRAELQALPPEERFLRAGEYISWITYTLLPDLGAQRRDCIVDLFDLNHWGTDKIATFFGMRRSTVVRLLDEGRAARKSQRLKRDSTGVLEPVPEPETDAA